MGWQRLLQKVTVLRLIVVLTAVAVFASNVLWRWTTDYSAVVFVAIGAASLVGFIGEDFIEVAVSTGIVLLLPVVGTAVYFSNVYWRWTTNNWIAIAVGVFAGFIVEYLVIRAYIRNSS